MFFEGATIYSYGRHYAMARFTELRDTHGRRVVFFKADGYSVSTAKHRNHTHHALHGLGVKVVYVDGVENSDAMNARGLIRDFATAADLIANPMRQRHVDLASRLGELSNRADTVREYLELTGVEGFEGFEAQVAEAVERVTAAMNAHNDPAKVAKRDNARALRLVKRLTLEQGRATAADLSEAVELWLSLGKPFARVAPLLDLLQRKRLAHEIAATAEALDPLASDVLGARREAEWQARYGAGREKITPEQWQEGKGAGYLYSAAWGTPTLVRRKGDRLETSRGVDVPFRQAVLAYLKATACRAKGETWHRNGQTVAVGAYQLDAIDERGNIRAGCHSIAFEEMQRLAVREIPEQVRAAFPVPALIMP
jgi:hypothetical protein